MFNILCTRFPAPFKAQDANNSNCFLQFYSSPLFLFLKPQKNLFSFSFLSFALLLSFMFERVSPIVIRSIAADEKQAIGRFSPGQAFSEAEELSS